MPKYVIERNLSGVGNLSHDDLAALAQKSCNILEDLGPNIQWVQSFVTADKLYCVYVAPSERLILEHARIGGFPVDRISEIRTVLGPSTAQQLHGFDEHDQAKEAGVY